MKGTVYLIRHTKTGAHKIGITGNWDRRSRELAVGEKNELVKTYRVKNAALVERALHRRFDAERLPQTEYFTLDADQLADVMETLEGHAQAFREEMLEKLKPAELTEQQREELALRRAVRQQQREEAERKAAELKAAKEAQAERFYAMKREQEREQWKQTKRFFRLVLFHAVGITAVLFVGNSKTRQDAASLFLAPLVVPFMVPAALMTAGIQGAVVEAVKGRAQV